MVRLAVLFAALALVAFNTLVHSAQYPTRPVRFVIPFPVGGPTDGAGRIIGQALSQSLGQSVVIDNRPGADGAIGPELVAKAPPDGYTISMATSSSMAAVPAMRKKPPYDPIADFTPITLVGWNSLLLVVNSKLPVKTVAELIEYSRANPGKVNVAAANPPSIFAMAQLKSIAKLETVDVTYKGDASALPDLLAGRVHVLAAGTNLVLPHVKEGRLRALATFMRTRTRPAPDVPTMAEAGVPRFAIHPWVGLFGPAKMPREVVDRLAREVNAAFKRPDVREQLDKIGFEPETSTPQELTAFVKEQIMVYAAVARDAGIPQQ
ncbi:MAG: Bug family tripartite tricarboxylate transporter substrate binding protein [Burkholderiales bacterium]